MFSKVNHRKKDKVIAGFRRFYSEGYVFWSKKNLEKLFEGELSYMDMQLLDDLEKNGFIVIKGKVDDYIEVIKLDI